MRLIVVVVCLITTLPPAAMEVEKEAMEKIDALFAAWNSTHTPGCSVAVDKSGEPYFRKAYGLANLDYAVPADPATQYHVASVSKQFTAAAVLLLVREGKVSLAAHPREYLPEVSALPDGITVRHLIHHTGGIRDQWDLLGLAGWRYARDRITNQDVMTMLARQRDLNFPPNSEYLYSNSGYTLLAEIVSRVSGQTFREFTNARLFQPVGMTETFFRDDFDEVVPDHAAGYVQKKAGGYALSVTNFDTAGATSLVTTPRDLVKWANLFITNDPLIDGMTTKGILADGEEISYAFGIDVSTRDDKTFISHGGSDAGYRAFLMTVPADAISIAVACNTTASPGRLSNALYRLLTDKTTESQTQPQSIPYPEAFNGDFYSSETRNLWRFRDGVATFLSFQAELLATGKRTLLIPSFGVTGEFNRTYSEVTISSPDDTAVYARVNASDDNLSPLAGAYYSEELDAVYRIRNDGGQMRLDYVKHPDVELLKVDENTLAGEVGTLEFTLDGQGRADGFTLNTFRIRNLAFRRINL